MVGRELLTICPHGEDHPAQDRGEHEIHGIATTDSAGVSGVDWRRYTRRMTTTMTMMTTTTIIVHMIAAMKKWRWRPMPARSSDLMPAPNPAPAGPATAQLPPLMIPCRSMMR